MMEMVIMMTQNDTKYGWDDDDSDDKLGAKALKCQ